MVEAARDRVVVVLVGLVLTLTILLVATGETPRVGPRDVGAYRLTCLSAGDCPATLGGPRDARGEPWIAVHPFDPAIIAVGAIGRSTEEDAVAAGDQASPAPPPEEDPDDRVRRLLGQEPPRPDDAPIGAPCTGLRLCLHVTEDGGATWIARSFPEKDGFALIADPSLVFTDDGTLHAVGHRASSYEIAYASSADLGRTWTRPIGISPTQGVDRPWLSTDGATLVVTWQTTRQPYEARLTYSTNGGQTWQILEPFGPRCSLQSPALPLADGSWLVGCTARGGLTGRILTLVDLAAETVETWKASDTWGRMPFFGRHPAGHLVLVESAAPTWTHETVLMRTSSDDGRTWQRAFDLLAPTALDNAWAWHWLSWATADDDGVVHAIVVGGEGPRCYNQDCADPAEREVIWLAADPLTGSLLGEAKLSDGARERPLDAQRNVGDDYHHVVAYPGGALVAWGHDHNVDVMRVEATV